MTLIGGWAAEAREAGGADVLLFPCPGDLEQVSLLAPGPATEGTNE